jgi:hypothetical protein
MSSKTAIISALVGESPPGEASSETVAVAFLLSASVLTDFQLADVIAGSLPQRHL